MTSNNSIFAALGVDDTTDEAKLAQHMVEDDFDLIEKLADARRRHGLTQTEVGRRMDISQAAVARIESGDRDPHLSTLRRYAHAIGVRVTHDVIDPETELQAAVRHASRDWTVGVASRAARGWAKTRP